MLAPEQRRSRSLLWAHTDSPNVFPFSHHATQVPETGDEDENSDEDDEDDESSGEEDVERGEDEDAEVHMQGLDAYDT